MIGDIINDILWGAAYYKSDGSVISTIMMRLWFSLLIIVGVIVVVLVLWIVFGKVTRHSPLEPQYV